MVTIWSAVVVKNLKWKLYWQKLNRFYNNWEAESAISWIGSEMTSLRVIWASLVAQLVKNLPAMPETPVWFLGWEDPLEEGMATHSSILIWRIPTDRGAWRATVHGVAKSRPWWATKHSTAQETFSLHFILFLGCDILKRLYFMVTF